MHLAPIKPLKNLVILSCALLLLSACAHQKQTMHSICLQHSASAHQAWLASIDHFKTAGKLKVYDTHHNPQTAYFVWKQAGKKLDVMLSGPFGIHPVHIEGNHKTWTITTEKNKKTLSHNTEAIQINGYTLPRNSAWIKGGILSQSHYQNDPQGYINTMQKDALSFDYTHRCNQGFWLPETITISEKGTILTTLSIRRWQIDHPA